MYKRHLTGRAGELYASSFLESKGYRIIARNLRTPFSEVDIVAVKDETLIFVEVKTRSSQKYGRPIESVTPARIKRLERAIVYFSKMHPELPKKLRIDVVSIKNQEGRARLEVIPVY